MALLPPPPRPMLTMLRLRKRRPMNEILHFGKLGLAWPSEHAAAAALKSSQSVCGLRLVKVKMASSENRMLGFAVQNFALAARGANAPTVAKAPQMVFPAPRTDIDGEKSFWGREREARCVEAASSEATFPRCFACHAVACAADEICLPLPPPPPPSSLQPPPPPPRRSRRWLRKQPRPQP